MTDGQEDEFFASERQAVPVVNAVQRLEVLQERISLDKEDEDE